MGFYVSKAVRIEAIKYTKHCELPAWVHQNLWRGEDGKMKVKGAKGFVEFEEGDMLIRELDGSGAYPCQEIIFKNKYEPVAEKAVREPEWDTSW